MTPLGFLNVRAMLNKIIIFSLFAGQNVNLSHHLYLFHWGLLYIPVKINSSVKSFAIPVIYNFTYTVTTAEFLVKSIIILVPFAAFLFHSQPKKKEFSNKVNK